MSKPVISENDELVVSVIVTNTGERASKHIVLLFLYDVYRRVTPEYKLLKRFQKIYLQPGEVTRVSWTLNSGDLKYIGLDYRYREFYHKYNSLLIIICSNSKVCA